MNYKTEEEKVLYALAIGLILMVMAYYAGNELGRHIKINESKQVSIEKTI